MPRLVEQLVHGRLLDGVPGVHDHHAIGQLGHQAQVVRDQHQRGVELAQRIAEHFEDLGLDGHVEGGGRLVRDQQAGRVGQGHSDHHPLGHATRELVRVLLGAALRVGDANQVEELEHALVDGRLRQPRIVDADGFADLVTHREDGVQRAGRVLENHGDVAAAHAPELRRRQAEQVASVEQGLARDDPGRSRWQEPQDGEHRYTLAGAGFAHDAQGFAGPHVEADPVDRREHAAARAEADPQIAHVQGCARRLGVRGRRGERPRHVTHAYWIRGSRNAYSRSTARFTSVKAATIIRITPCRTV